MELNDDQHIVLEMVKAWLEEYDIVVLAAEKVAVQWASLDGSATKLGWRKDSLASTVNILRGTVVPLALMPSMSTDVLLAAAQESERIYERGVTVNGLCLPQYFNYNSRRQLSAEEKMVKGLIELCLATGHNVDGASVRTTLDMAFARAGLNPMTAVPRNRMIDSFKEELQFNYRYSKNRLCIMKEGSTDKYTCIQRLRLVEVPITLDDETREKWSRMVMEQALIK